ncbi:MAG TPA: dihydrodipicolinate reductase C-terminal domain-containing protein [Bryobacteraceae bacterium]|jgi:4-hydroxy-tetrahydrodipicolinate reductase|nr:dihydrodipicolinate reductase C-terminal domain-containing protein [Bryobacteraceae bacterium]
MSSTKTLAIVGYGKMGRLVAQLAPEYDFEVIARLTRADRDQAISADVAIEFSTPEAAPENLLRLAKARIPAVCGTTGWLSRLPEITQAVEENGSALVWSPNFSTGVAVFRRIAALGAELLRDKSEYGAWAWEIHHDAKKDAPSGTLLALVETMRGHGYDRPIDVAANRAGKHPGTHEIGFDSAADTITLRHAARSREGFARGALKSAQWLLGKSGVFTFEDVLFG